MNNDLYFQIDYDSFSDVTLIIGDQKFRAHRLILMNYSDFFNVYLKNNSEETIEIECENANLFKNLLDLIYHHQTSIYGLNILKLILLIQFFGIKGIDIDTTMMDVYSDHNNHEEYLKLLDLIYPCGYPESIRNEIINDSTEFLCPSKSFSDTSKFLYTLNLRAQSFSDLKIITDNQTFNVHKSVLINNSRYFASILNEETETIELEEDADLFNGLLNIMYGQRITVSSRYWVQFGDFFTIPINDSVIINGVEYSINTKIEQLEMIRLINFYGIKGIDLTQLMIDFQLIAEPFIYTAYSSLLDEIYPKGVPKSIEEKVNLVRVELDNNARLVDQ